MEFIQSKQNQRIKNYRKLQTSKGRQQGQAYLIEGDHLIQEAIKAKLSLECVLLTPEYQAKHPEMNQVVQDLDLTVLQVSDEVLQSLALTETAQGIMAVVKQSLIDLQGSDFKINGNRYLLCDRVQDPGNLGTMIRTADAANFDGVILSQGCVDPFNDKVIRASQGSLWHLPIIQASDLDIYQAIKSNQLKIFATALHQSACDYRQVAGQAGVLVVGNEGQGVSHFWLEQADQLIYIPMPGQAESLNVAIAAGILMFAWI